MAENWHLFQKLFVKYETWSDIFQLTDLSNSLITYHNVRLQLEAYLFICSAAVDQILDCLDHVSLLTGCYNTSEGPVVEGILAEPHIASLLEVC